MGEIRDRMRLDMRYTKKNLKKQQEIKLSHLNIVGFGFQFLRLAVL